MDKENSGVKQSWHKIYSTQLYTEAAIVQGKLEINHIPVQILNKQDSMYNIAIGEFELYVPLHFRELALNLLNQGLAN
jgi:hypothetical protein